MEGGGGGGGGVEQAECPLTRNQLPMLLCKKDVLTLPQISHFWCCLWQFSPDWF